MEQCDVLLGHDIGERGSGERRQTQGGTHRIDVAGTAGRVAGSEPCLRLDQLILGPRNHGLAERKGAPDGRIDDRGPARRRWRRASRGTHGRVVLIRADKLVRGVRIEIPPHPRRVIPGLQQLNQHIPGHDVLAREQELSPDVGIEVLHRAVEEPEIARALTVDSIGRAGRNFVNTQLCFRQGSGILGGAVPLDQMQMVAGLQRVCRPDPARDLRCTRNCRGAVDQVAFRRRAVSRCGGGRRSQCRDAFIEARLHRGVNALLAIEDRRLDPGSDRLTVRQIAPHRGGGRHGKPFPDLGDAQHQIVAGGRGGCLDAPQAQQPATGVEGGHLTRDIPFPHPVSGAPLQLLVVAADQLLREHGGTAGDLPLHPRRHVRLNGNQ